MHAVFTFDLSTLSEPEFEKYYAKMPAYRQAKIDKCLMTDDKKRSLGVGMLLKYALHNLGINGEPDISYTEHQKPYFTYLPELHFNLSHSGNIVMCIIGDCEVGCDVEVLSRRADLEVAKRFFFCDEYRKIADAKTKEEQIDMFFRMWTLKESFIKCVGAGLSLPLDSFCINLGEEITVEQDIYSGNYLFKEVDVMPNYKCSYCIKDGIIPDFASNTLVEINDISKVF